MLQCNASFFFHRNLFYFRHYSKNKFKRFDLRSVHGYFSQAIVLSLKIPAELEKDGEYCSPGKTKFPMQLETLYSKCMGTKICRSPQTEIHTTLSDILASIHYLLD
jgi:hypothetical protein